MRRPPFRRCAPCGKRSYALRNEAESTAEHEMALGSPVLTPYECPEGAGWHLTKTVYPKIS